MENNLERFVEAQIVDYQTALAEIRAGRKQTHWIWYIFPQLKGLGQSHFSQYYGISGREEAIAYLSHETLGQRLREITQALLSIDGKEAIDILGRIDAQKVRSSMTLFDAVSPNDIFAQLLEKFYRGRRCAHTLKFLSNH